MQRASRSHSAAVKSSVTLESVCRRSLLLIRHGPWLGCDKTPHALKEMIMSKREIRGNSLSLCSPSHRESFLLGVNCRCQIDCAGLCSRRGCIGQFETKSRCWLSSSFTRLFLCCLPTHFLSLSLCVMVANRLTVRGCSAFKQPSVRSAPHGCGNKKHTNSVSGSALRHA